MFKGVKLFWIFINKIFKIILDNIINTMEILDKKEILNDTIHEIITEYQKREISHTHECKLFTEEIERINMFNKKLLEEIRNKDKCLSLNDKKLFDYEQIINEYQTKEYKEIESKEKHEMIRIQDKEIHERDQEIKILKGQLEKKKDEIKNLNEKFNSVISNVKVSIDDNDNDGCFGFSPTSSPLQLILKKEDPDVIKEDPHDIKENPDDIKEDPDDIKEDPDDIKEDSDDDNDGVSVEIIKYHRKEYFIILGEDPRYIYAIEEGELGDKVGVIEGNKKVFYKKK